MTAADLGIPPLVSTADWLDDDAMPAEETLRRFDALEALEVEGP